jgi:type II secretory pathway component PulF
MPTYKYQSATSTGVSVFGIFDAADENALASYLLTRGMTLVDFSEVSIDKQLGSQLAAIPRVLQLRIGERVQEALLTGLPAHVAIAAMANEPFEHPLLMAMPWLTGLAGCAVLVSLLLMFMIPEFVGALMLAAALGMVVCVAFWIVGYWWLEVRPKKLLLRLSQQMAAGNSESLMQEAFVPTEIRSIMDSEMASQQKSLSVAELLPSLGIMQVQRHLFATRMVAPFLALLLLVPAAYAALLIIIPQFKQIFSDFGVPLPGITLLIIGLSDFTAKLGMPGLISVFLFFSAVAGTVYGMMVWSPAAEVLSVVPMLGTSLRMLMQARVARVLGVLIRNHSSVPDAVTVATDASGFREVRRRGKEIASEMKSGAPANLICSGLHGLPLSLLLRVNDQEESEAARQETAQSFMMFASSLEQASFGQGSILAIGIEMLAIWVTGVVMFVFVVSMFLPLVRLLNDLAACFWARGAWL